MQTTSYKHFTAIVQPVVRNGSAQFTAILRLKRLFSSLLGVAVFFDEIYSRSVPLVTGAMPLWCGGSMVLHKRDGCQLLTELFQHDHTL